MREEFVGRLEELGSRTAMIDRDVPYTYRDLAEGIRGLQETLDAHQVRPHDVVVLNSDFSFPSIATLFALFINRNVIVPVVNLTEGTLATITESCFPTHVVKVDEDAHTATWAAGAATRGRNGKYVQGATGKIANLCGTAIFPLAATSAAPTVRSDFYDRLVSQDAAGLVLLSSGSTGVPKAILHNLDSIVAEKLLGRRERAAGRAADRASNILMFLLFDHIGGINSLLGALRVGGTAIVPRRRTPDEICALIERHQIRLLPTSPTFLNLILIGGYHRKHDLSSLRLVTYGTEPMPEELLRRVHEAFPRARLLQTFGTSETGISTTTSESSRSTYFKIDDPNVQYRIIDGELQLKTATQFLGYLNYPSDSLTEDEWFRTGDLVEENADGFIRVKGRSKEVINVGGEKVLPLELESILLASPLIDDCVVYGRQNAITGQSVCVDIKPSGDMSRAEVRKHVMAFLAGKVEQFKIPSKINLVDGITVSDRFKKKRIVP